MTLSMAQGINIDPKTYYQTIATQGAYPQAGNDFSSLFNMLMASSMNSMNPMDSSSLFGSTDSGSSLQNLLFSLAPLLQNLNQSNVMGKPPAGVPVQGVLTQNYHSTHHGLDFGIPEGTSVRSTMSGVVKYAGWNDEGYGNLVIVDNGTYQTYYGHLRNIPVQVGEQVSAGEVIGLSGNTGNSTGPHLHYEVRVDGKAVNPTSYSYGVASAYRS